MPSPEAIRKLSTFGALVLPVAVVKFATVFMGQTVPAAQAASAVAVPVANAATPVSKAKVTPQQVAAARYADSLRLQPFGPTPLYVEKTQTVDAAQTIPPLNTSPNTHTPSSGVVPAPTFTVGAVMSTSGGGRALINGRPYREGQQVHGTTWVVTTINSSSRSVTLNDSQTNRSVVVSVELPW